LPSHGLPSNHPRRRPLLLPTPPELPTPSVATIPLPPVQETPSPKPPAQKTQPPASGTSRPVASKPRPPFELGPVVDRNERQNLERQLDKHLADAEGVIAKSKKYKLSPEEMKILERVRVYVQQAKAARAMDLQEACNAAERADLLSKELQKMLRRKSPAPDSGVQNFVVDANVDVLQISFSPAVTTFASSSRSCPRYG
jgi:hypothetical protein